MDQRDAAGTPVGADIQEIGQAPDLRYLDLVARLGLLARPFLFPGALFRFRFVGHGLRLDQPEIRVVAIPEPPAALAATAGVV